MQESQILQGFQSESWSSSVCSYVDYLAGMAAPSLPRSSDLLVLLFSFTPLEADEG